MLILTDTRREGEARVGAARTEARTDRRRMLRALGAALAAGVPWPAAASALAASADPADLDVVLGELGPQLVARGAIEPVRFAQACAASGVPLDAERLRILRSGSDKPIAFDASGAHFLLNFFWALGLANANPVLTRGAMTRSGLSRIAGFASTGGWTLAARPVMDLYARLPLVPLTSEQQQRLEEVASRVYRPCCDNATDFPDCNHGMAMLGLLTRLAADGRDADGLFKAAGVANRFWFPQQTEQVAHYLHATRGVDRAGIDAREAAGPRLFSASGFRKVTAWLTQHGLGAPAGGARCAA